MSGHLTPLDLLQSDLQLAGFHYIACLRAKPTSSDHEIKLGQTVFTFANIEGIRPETRHGLFQRWAGGVVLRDLIESFSLFLTRVFQKAYEAEPGLKWSASPDAFERKGLEDQLATTAADFAVDDRWVVRLVGLNRARNCLAHRLGIVGERDLTEGGDLVIRWLSSETTILEGPPHSTDVTMEGPMNDLIRGRLEFGPAVRARIMDREKRVPLNGQLVLLPIELFQIISTLGLAGAAFSVLNRKPGAD